MTDEERRRDLLSRLHGFGSHRNPRNIPICKEAADEIERLAALAQSDAKPVAWQYRIYLAGEWTAWKETLNPNYWREQTGTEIRALYTAPPRPDASAEPRFTLDEIEAAMDRVLERRGLKTQVDNLERRSA